MTPSFKKDPEEFKGRKLLAENVFDLLPGDDDCFIYEDIFSQIDTKALEEKYSMLGRHAYHPKLNVAILIYAYSQEIYSSRKIEERCRKDLSFMYISHLNCPNFRVLADFRKKNLAFFSECFKKTVEMAKELAEERNLAIHYEVQDICELPHEGKLYDLIVDSYCLQGIVTDQDRQKVFAAVRACLKAEGYYLISTAIFDESRYRPDDIILDAHNGVVYNGYGESLIIDMQSSIVYARLEEGPENYEDAIQIGGAWYLPVRRHRKPSALEAELEVVGFDVSYQDGGNMICVLR